MVKLQESIDKFICINDKEPYAFMSSDTCDLLMKETEKRIGGFNFARKVLPLTDISRHGIVATFEGIRVYDNEDLPLRVVELR